jgi:hypothetical protein
MRSRHYLVAVGVATCCLAAGDARPALADDRPVSVGPYAQVSVGGKASIGKKKSYAAQGPALRIQVGTDLFQWLSVGGRVSLASHEATVPAPPEGEYMQFYEGAAEARLSVNIGRVAVFAEGTVGYSAVSTNILEKVDLLEPGERFSPTFGAGGGLEYQLQNRHYAFGLGGHWTLYQAFSNMQMAAAVAHMRYTY